MVSQAQILVMFQHEFFRTELTEFRMKDQYPCQQLRGLLPQVIPGDYDSKTLWLCTAWEGSNSPYNISWESIMYCGGRGLHFWVWSIKGQCELLFPFGGCHGINIIPDILRVLFPDSWLHCIQPPPYHHPPTLTHMHSAKDNRTGMFESISGASSKISGSHESLETLKHGVTQNLVPL